MSSLIAKIKAQAEAKQATMVSELMETKVTNITIAPSVKSKDGTKEFPRYRATILVDGIPTNIWLFQENVHGADHTTFIPKTGFDAIATVVPNKYTKTLADGVTTEDVDSFTVNHIKIDAAGAQYAALAKAGVSVNLAKAV